MLLLRCFLADTYVNSSIKRLGVPKAFEASGFSWGCAFGGGNRSSSSRVWVMGAWVLAPAGALPRRCLLKVLRSFRQAGLCDVVLT